MPIFLLKNRNKHSESGFLVPPPENEPEKPRDTPWDWQHTYKVEPETEPGDHGVYSKEYGFDCPWCPWFDKVMAQVVRAKNEKEARLIAAESAGPEKDFKAGNPWLTDEWSTCTEIDPNGMSEVLLQDIHEP